MKLRVLFTNGSKTVDLLWLRHTGTDVYYGFVGHNRKFSYHASGARHESGGDDERLIYDKHQPLSGFSGEIVLTTFGFNRNVVDLEFLTAYQGKKSDAVIYLGSRTLPKMVSIAFGLTECGMFPSLPEQYAPDGVEKVIVITNTTPWIFVMVIDASKHVEIRGRYSSVDDLTKV